MKTLEKSEMLERNKAGRVLTEEGILNQGMLPTALSLFADCTLISLPVPSCMVKPKAEYDFPA